MGSEALQPGSIAEVSARLKSWCTRHRHGLARVEWDSAHARRAVVEQLRESLSPVGIPVVEIDLPHGEAGHQTADGLIAEHWMPVSPATGRLDAFRWRVPVADLTPRGPLLEPAPSAPAIPAPTLPVPVSPAAPPASPPTKDVTPPPKRAEARPKAEVPAPPAPKSAPAPEPMVESAAVEVLPPAPATIEIRPAPVVSVPAPPPSTQAKEATPPAEPPILVPDDPGPEPESPSTARTAQARARRSWFSRNTAG